MCEGHVLHPVHGVHRFFRRSFEPLQVILLFQDSISTRSSQIPHRVGPSPDGHPRTTWHGRPGPVKPGETGETLHRSRSRSVVSARSRDNASDCCAVEVCVLNVGPDVTPGPTAVMVMKRYRKRDLKKRRIQSISGTCIHFNPLLCRHWSW